MSDLDTPPSMLVPDPEQNRLAEVAGLFLRLGFTAFGGPAAHIAMMRNEVVQRRPGSDGRCAFAAWAQRSGRSIDMGPGTHRVDCALALQNQFYLAYSDWSHCWHCLFPVTVNYDLFFFSFSVRLRVFAYF